ncbi:dihydroorotate oxidase A [Labedella gwakjiensis]|uniref:Dihydroorotate dehydrogenase (quinone) n=1 Tax=Labedella gwakjiensis TaxID=390269 RepID=A0A2P8H046_9MICO|nr:quinone-dependent dihydroorotate dehydrogenase [Labedella gwakjiensis]PSL39601.1 dihydroorotate oxidase A [Labedella gwakjiensis]RUQ86006.1 quinone-dependent dihydroorotate dehydrogenase [Labedella gwakjiensis]
MYRALFSLFLKRLDPERAHHLAFAVIRSIPRLGIAGAVSRFTRAEPDEEVRALGLTFSSPFGVAAGFDKNAEAIMGLGSLGFSHVEVGTLTARSQPGNPKPRMFRFVEDRAVVNRMGFNNGGAAGAAERIRAVRSLPGRPVIGVNIGKSRVVEVDDAIDDYLESTRVLAPLADYLVVNVSSPNTPGLRGLQEIDRLAPLLSAVKAAAGGTPLLVKIAPDLADDEVVRIAVLVQETALDGVIATNTTISRDGLTTPSNVIEAAGAGGLSGKPLAERSIAVLRILRRELPADSCVISVGGIETAEDVRERLEAGATLVQGYTGFVYAGPLWARAVNRGLARLRVQRGPVVPTRGTAGA